MAYTNTYAVPFRNEQSQEVIILIAKKDGPVVDIQNYEAISVEISDRSEGQTKYDSTIITRELTLTLWTVDGQDITWETFIADEHDTWKVTITIDAQPYFEGFITPDEGNSPFQDKPYEVTFRATNGLSLLKDVPLVDINGDKFNNQNTLISYIAGALKQTGLELPIRIYCNYYNSNLPPKWSDGTRDMFNQCQLEYQTFLKNPTEFVSCYEALTIILNKFCRIEYWNGYWLIKSIAELQYMPGRNYYVDYSSDGATLGYDEDTTNHYQIGKAVDLYPINEDQQIYSRFAIKTAKTIYNYNVWPELPINNVFDRGTVFETGDQADDEDINGDGNTSEIIGTYKKYTINDWEYGQINWFDFPNPTMSPISQIFYRKSVYNEFGIETQRLIVAETPPIVTDSSFWLRSKPIPVNYGDRINVSAQKRCDNDMGSISMAVFSIYIVSNDGSRVVKLTNYPKWEDAIASPFGLIGVAGIFSTTTLDSSKWNVLDLKSPVIPFDGNLYIALEPDPDFDDPGPLQYWKDIRIEYIPYLAGGYVKVKGDYWLRSQDKVFPDKAEEEVSISDSQKKLFKGALLDPDGELTTPTWYRFGRTGSVFFANPLSEFRQFKELLNIARFNHSYRRMYALEGSFNGLNAAAENDQLHKYPIRFDKRYRAVDMTDQRDFVLVPPLKMDLIKGWISASLVEVRKVDDGDTDGTQTGDSSSFNYIFENNG